MSKEKVLKEAIKRGWYLHRSKKHYIFKHKSGGFVTVSKSESEKRAWLEIKKDFIHQENLFNHRGELK